MLRDLLRAGQLQLPVIFDETVAPALVQQVSAQPKGTVIVASDTSCRHQLEHLTPVHPKHMAELLADAIS